MSKLIDFSDCEVLTNTYDGADSKFPIIFDGERYMLKFGELLESDPKKPLQASYSNAPVSEHLGSNIFHLIGIPAQQTLLGVFDGQKVVACKDFIYTREDRNNYELVEFKKLETSFLGSSTIERTPKLENIEKILFSHPKLDFIRADARQRYWEMFIGDALVGNFDRHAGNWGYILDKEINQLVELAPIYDCGSTFYPKLDEGEMEKMLAMPDKICERILDFPRASLKVNDKKVYYHIFLLSAASGECGDILRDLFPKIDLAAIRSLIYETPGLSAVQKSFYTALINTRHEQILAPAYEKALEIQNRAERSLLEPKS